MEGQKVSSLAIEAAIGNLKGKFVGNVTTRMEEFADQLNGLKTGEKLSNQEIDENIHMMNEVLKQLEADFTQEEATIRSAMEESNDVINSSLGLIKNETSMFDTSKITDAFK